MDQKNFEDFSELTAVLSQFIIANKINPEHFREEFSKAFLEFAQVQKVSKLEGLMDLNHYVKGHGRKTVKLNCGVDHCVECYEEILREGNYVVRNTFCTCGQSIPPKFRKALLDEFNK